jgi:hypothetical protein
VTGAAVIVGRDFQVDCLLAIYLVHVLVVAKVLGRGAALVLAVGRYRTPGELERQQDCKQQDEQTPRHRVDYLRWRIPGLRA